MGDVLGRARVTAEAEGGQNPPFRNVEAVALLIFAGEFRADFGGQPVQPERREFEEIELGQGTDPGFSRGGKA